MTLSLSLSPAFLDLQVLLGMLLTLHGFTRSYEPIGHGPPTRANMTP